MRALLVYIHYPVSSGEYIKRAFQRLGHDVRSIGPSSGNNIWGMVVDFRHSRYPDGHLTAHWSDWTPDLIIVCDSAWAYHHPVYQSVPHIVWGVDNHVVDYRQAGIAHYFLAHNAVSVMDMSAPDVTWLPCATDPEWFTPSPIAWADRVYDVAIVGVMYEGRVQAVTALRDAGLNVFAGMGLLYDDYAAVYHNARIALNVSSNHDLSQRIFETAAMGCAVLTDTIPDLDAIESYPIFQYGDVKEVVRKAKAILKEAPPVDGKWTWEHTYDMRAKEVVAWYNQVYHVEETQADV